MENDERLDTPTPPEPLRIGDLERLIDERDETIRLLTEALSRALDELQRTHAA